MGKFINFVEIGAAIVFERVNYNIHTRHAKIHLMSPRIRPICTKRSTINISRRPKTFQYQVQTFG